MLAGKNKAWSYTWTKFPTSCGCQTKLSGDGEGFWDLVENEIVESIDKETDLSEEELEYLIDDVEPNTKNRKSYTENSDCDESIKEINF